MTDELSCACIMLRQATRVVTAAYDKALAPSGLRITQFSVLRTLANHGPMAVTELAKKVALERSTVGRNLDPLERRGLVRLEIGANDQRERIAHLTRAGKAAIQTALPRWRETQDRIGPLLDETAISTLVEKIYALNDR